MSSITNLSKVPLLLSVWAVNDDYDYGTDPSYISATALIKPLRSLVLGARVKDDPRTDVQDFVAASLGSSIHAAVEQAWKENYKKNLQKLGYPESLVKRFRINPEPGTIDSTTIPVFIEQRRIKEVLGWKVGGKFDAVIDGLLYDIKSTSCYSYIYGSNEEAYKLQGSIYKWLNPDLIKEDYIRICYIFTDWKKADAEKDSNYPQQRVLYKDIPLMSVEETESWIKNRLETISLYMNKPDSEIPECTDKELWRPDPVYKYYSNPDNVKGRATKNFNNLAEANKYCIDKGKGIVITVAGEPRRCNYCKAYPICEQRKRILPDHEFNFD